MRKRLWKCPIVPAPSLPPRCWPVVIVGMEPWGPRASSGPQGGKHPSGLGSQDAQASLHGGTSQVTSPTGRPPSEPLLLLWWPPALKERISHSSVRQSHLDDWLEHISEAHSQSFQLRRSTRGTSIGISDKSPADSDTAGPGNPHSRKDVATSESPASAEREAPQADMVLGPGACSRDQAECEVRPPVEGLASGGVEL